MYVYEQQVINDIVWCMFNQYEVHGFKRYFKPRLNSWKKKQTVQIEPNNKPKMFATSILSLDHAVVWWYMNYNIIDSELIKVYECICSGKLTIALCWGSIIIILTSSTMDCKLVSCADYVQWYMSHALLSASVNLNVQAGQIEPSIAIQLNHIQWKVTIYFGNANLTQCHQKK